MNEAPRTAYLEVVFGFWVFFFNLSTKLAIREKKRKCLPQYPLAL